MLRKAALLAVTIMLCCCPAALAAFPGHDGVLAVQPLTGGGIELVHANGTGAHRICTDALLCGHPIHPRFSANGQAIAFADGRSHRIAVVATDGTCLWCLLGAPLTSVAGSDPSFAGNDAVLFAPEGTHKIQRTSLGAHRLRAFATGRDAAVSADGGRAVVRGGAIFTRGRHGLVKLVSGSGPSWSPGGTSLAFSRVGWVWIIAVRHGATPRRLVRGTSPAWSPDGRRIAYIAPGGAVTTIATSGHRRLRVGTVRGRSVDWQPLTQQTTAGCPSSPGSVADQGPEGNVRLTTQTKFSQRFPLWSGCLRLTHSHVALYSTFDHQCPDTHLVHSALSGRYAALGLQCGGPNPAGCIHHYGLFDLASGAPLDLFDAADDSSTCANALDDLRVDSSGFAAARLTQVRPVPFTGPEGIACPSAALCVMPDAWGNVVVSGDPEGGAARWSVVPVSPEPLAGVSCPSTTFCLAAAAGGVATTTDPLGGAGTWRFRTPDPAYALSLPTCPSPSFCALADSFGDILTSSDPRAARPHWTRTKLVDTGTHNDIIGLSCPTSSLCVVSDANGSVYWSTDPGGGAKAWSSAGIGPQGLTVAGRVTCPTVNFCLGAASDEVFTSSDPTAGAGSWTVSSVPGALDPLTCASPTLCIVLARNGSLLTSTDPAGGSAAWHEASVPGGGVQFAACASNSFCALTTFDPQTAVLTSATPADAPSYTPTPVDRLPCELAGTQPCVLEALYARDDSGMRVVDAATGTGKAIANVALSGNSTTLAWTHDGQPRSLALH
jgi:WD40-like Beta Propeller Repeat